MVTISSGTTAQIEALFADKAVQGFLRVLIAGIDWNDCKEQVADAISNITYCTVIRHFKIVSLSLKTWFYFIYF